LRPKSEFARKVPCQNQLSFKMPITNSLDVVLEDPAGQPHYTIEESRFGINQPSLLVTCWR
jgi:hypothetical protein